MKGTSTPNVFVKGTSTPNVFVKGTSTPKAFVKGTSTPKALANSSPGLLQPWGINTSCFLNPERVRLERNSFRVQEGTYDLTQG
jgi:hypothetical protein